MQSKHLFCSGSCVVLSGNGMGGGAMGGFGGMMGSQGGFGGNGGFGGGRNF